MESHTFHVVSVNCTWIWM